MHAYSPWCIVWLKSNPYSAETLLVPSNMAHSWNHVLLPSADMYNQICKSGWTCKYFQGLPWCVVRITMTGNLEVLSLWQLIPLGWRKQWNHWIGFRTSSLVWCRTFRIIILGLDIEPFILAVLRCVHFLHMMVQKEQESRPVNCWNPSWPKKRNL